jgi:hypothetical protein
MHGEHHVPDTQNDNLQQAHKEQQLVKVFSYQLQCT